MKAGQFWKDEEENAGLVGGASAGQVAGRSLVLAKLIRNGQLDPGKLPVDADGNFILPDGTVLTRGDLNAILYGGTQDADLRFSDGSQVAKLHMAGQVHGPNFSTTIRLISERCDPNGQNSGLVQPNNSLERMLH
ncbi:MAG: hypothetical protein CMN76_13525 [Spirochaetaceae bacterium]|nr:hypothetical protein [Spirochaetaceae bacterium]